ncbi:SHOCT domain-containing protein [Rhodococcus sp. D2-41]|uniref:SHOCT domain-containing protein n=1 Tax=Speluncibacter jeojiensis TaxID=2710754 RepID=A0A9X4LXS6_9ACTN|nr:SHOCT domain-containing protein [Rhodococcus sp. D2-41]MDG3010591.1 SHOCT domain-containing protein [Rhodococcus sp. D2-41]MDG3014338.1 SHOCT domain-containing protein [Corynebacteriales bacterium D3-21]
MNTLIADPTTTALLADTCYRHGWGPGPWFVIFPILFWIAVIAFFVMLRRRRLGCTGRGGESTLADLFARGEITEEQYRTRRDVLREKRK